MKFYDIRTREQKMCGFRTDQELGIALGIMFLLLVLSLIK